MPHIDYYVPLTKIESLARTLSLLLLLLMFVATAASFSSLPQRIVTHYNFAAEPDGWGDRWTVWLLPIIGVGIYFLFRLAVKYPQYFN